MLLSIQCSKCGATNKFDQDNIPTFCSFCGAALPNMRPYVDDAIKLSLERKRHEMDMEIADKEIKKEKVKSKSDKHDTIQIIVIALIVFGYFLFMMKLISR